MNNLLLDTSIIIDFLRREDKEASILYKLASQNTKLSISIITHTELYAGKSVWESKKAQQELGTLFSGLQIQPLEVNTSQLAGKLRAQYNMHLLDAIIAATALNSRMELVTLNIKDFKKIDGLRLSDF